MDKILVHVESEVHPTESVEKVLSAIKNVFPTLQPQVYLEEGVVKAKAEGIESLTKLHNLLRRERIRDAAKALLRKCVTGSSVTFYINKQAAFVKRLSFSEPIREDPLGPIKVTVECDSPNDLIEWLTRT
ncbi:MAG: RNA-binding domain-containing protein [Candidatus Bathyarchaeia archaeon]